VSRASAPSPPRPEPRIEVAPCSVGEVLALERELGVSNPVAQILARRGYGAAPAARAFLEAAESHPPSAFAGIETAVELILRHVRARSQITVHGDYDCDGVCSTAILVRTLRALGADCDWYLPDRLVDGYGLNDATVARIAARGTRLLITADCAITAVEPVAAARAAGLDVVVTDHHSPRADGALPDAPIVHPAVCGYPCAALCATGVAYKLAAALHEAAGGDPARADAELDLVALATIADVVPLLGENRRLVRTGLRELARTPRPGLLALMRVARVDPSRVDERAVGFRLAPRINAAGRLYRADAGLELLLTEDPGRAAAIAEELDHANAERRNTETRILFEAEAQVAEAGEAPAYVLAGSGWHPGVVGIVAARIAERHHRPAVLIALPEEGAPGNGTGSARSIPTFDLLAGLDATAEQLVRHGGHRAAAGLEISPQRLEAFRSAFCAHAAATLAPDDLVPVKRADAVVAGDEIGLALAEELARLGPFGAGNPPVALLLAATTLRDPVRFGDGAGGGDHVRFTVESGGARARAVCFGAGGRLPVDAETPVDATFALELNEWHGAVEARLLLRHARPCRPAPVAILGEPSGFLEGVLQELDRELAGEPTAADDAAAAPAAAREQRDLRGRGVAGSIAALVHSGEPVLVVCADAAARARHVEGRLGGFALCSYEALEGGPALADGFDHVVLLDPPVLAQVHRITCAGRIGQFAHLLWGEPELRFALHIHEREYGLRASLTTLYRALRDRGSVEGESLESALRGDPAAPRGPALAGRLLRVLTELGLVELDRERSRAAVTTVQQRTELDWSPAYRAYTKRYEDGRQYLSEATQRAA
jgi:single-stranded-DNA-specific exonuclease